MNSPVTYNKDHFIIGGRKLRIAAGAIHYFRVPRELWRDRIYKAKLSGLNAIETYLAWNAHEFREGEFDFSGNLDLDAYFKICEEAGMYIIVRPGPYICSEWDNGGLPAWLNIKPGIRLRTFNRPYLEAVDKYFDRCVPIVAKHQFGNAGNIIMVQVENEYLCPKRFGGKRYMEYLRDGLRARGIHVPLCSCDHMAQPIKGVLQTHNNGENFKKISKAYRKAYPKNPFIITEFWCGWFDSWGNSHNTKDPKVMAKYLKDINDIGGMYIQYMFCGGTNFGFWGGRTIGSDDHIFMPTTYDFHAPLGEAGNITQKFIDFSKVNYAMNGQKAPGIKPTRAPQKLLNLPTLSRWVHFDPVVQGWKKIKKFESFEKLGRYLGYGFYKVLAHSAEAKSLALYFPQYGDRIKVFANGSYYGTFGRAASKEPVRVLLNKGKNELLFLVDNMGRFNFSLRVGELKGIFGPVFTDSVKINPVWVVSKVKKFKFYPNKQWDAEIYSHGGELKKMWPAKPMNDREFILAETTFEAKAGKRYFTEFITKDMVYRSLFINGKQVYYARPSHIATGILEVEVTKFVKPGVNEVELFQEGQDTAFLKDCKFVEGGAELKGEILFAPFETLEHGQRKKLGPLKIWRTTFDLGWPAYPVRLRMDGMSKGQIYLNGRNVGRYWQPKPQRDYYLPEPWLKGKNELVIFEEEGRVPDKVKLVYDSHEAFVG